MGVDLMHDELQKFGFGSLTGIDIQGEMRGVLPSPPSGSARPKAPEQQKWYSGETISLGIGQATTTSPCCSSRWPPPSSPTTA